MGGGGPEKHGHNECQNPEVPPDAETCRFKMPNEVAPADLPKWPLPATQHIARHTQLASACQPSQEKHACQ